MHKESDGHITKGSPDFLLDCKILVLLGFIVAYWYCFIMKPIEAEKARQSAGVAFVTEVESEIDKARGDPNPELAFFRLYNIYVKTLRFGYCEEGYWDSYYAEPYSDAIQELVRAVRGYEGMAVKEGSARVTLASYCNGRNENFATYAKQMLQSTDKHPNMSNLYVAAHIMYSGRYVVRNLDKSVEYYSMAWVRGKSEAANDLSAVFTGLNDPINAYLWSLRCVHPCIRGEGLEPSSLQRNMSANSIAVVERAAEDRTVLRIGAGHRLNGV